MLKTEFEFALEDKVEYRVGGNTKTAQTIVLKAPCYNDTKQVLKLHGLINQGITQWRLKREANQSVKNDDSDTQQEPTQSEITQALKEIVYLTLVSGECDTDSILDIFTSLLIKSAKLDGEAVLTSLHLDQISPQTILKLLGEYVVNFPLAA